MVDVELWQRRRKDMGITLEELSKRSGVPIRTICSILSGTTPNPRVATVSAIEQVLQITPVQVETYVYGLSDDEKVLIDYYRRLTPGNKLIVFNMLKSVFDDARDLPIETVSEYLGRAG